MAPWLRNRPTHIFAKSSLSLMAKNRLKVEWRETKLNALVNFNETSLQLNCKRFDRTDAVAHTQ